MIAYASKTFNGPERQYCTTRKELAAVIYALKEFRHYVLGGVHFVLRTDHGALTSLFKVPVPIQQQARYLNFLADYNFEIQHRAGTLHGNSDGLSRRPCGSNKCPREDCEEGPRENRPAQSGRVFESRMQKSFPLRSGKPYLKKKANESQSPLGPRNSRGPSDPAWGPRNQKGPRNPTRSPQDSNLFQGPAAPQVGRHRPHEPLGSSGVPQSGSTSRPNRSCTPPRTLDIPWETIQEAQEADPVLQTVRKLLQEPDPPACVNEYGMGVVNLWNQRKSLVVINGVLHRNFETVEGLVQYQQILVPLALRMRFLYWVHGDPTSGHFGVQKTSDKLQCYAYWSGWRKDAELFVRRCDVCCRYRKGPVRPQGAMKNGVGLAPFQKFHIDLTGPHRRSSGGHVYLLTGICCFTKYLIAVPLKDKSALAVANALLKNVYLVYGAVELQVHDNGPEFVNAILQHLSKMLGIQDLRSTVYRPVANSQIERVHRTINAVFAKTIRENQRDWHEQTKYVCFAYNTAKHSSTLFSPFYLVFLREPRVGIDLFLDRCEPAYRDTDEYCEKVQERMQKAYQVVGEHLKATFDRAKRRYDQRVREVRFKLHEYVWFYCPRLKAGRGRKFRKLTDGPYRIVRVLNDVNYVIQKTPGARLQICHVDRLLRYEGTPPIAWVKYDEAQREQNRETERLQMIVEPELVADLTQSAAVTNQKSETCGLDSNGTRNLEPVPRIRRRRITISSSVKILPAKQRTANTPSRGRSRQIKMCVVPVSDVDTIWQSRRAWRGQDFRNGVCRFDGANSPVT